MLDERLTRIVEVVTGEENAKFVERLREQAEGMLKKGDAPMLAMRGHQADAGVVIGGRGADALGRLPHRDARTRRRPSYSNLR